MWFGWPFFIFLWNLMARSHSVGNIMLQHIRWADDSLIVRLPKHKGDQEGDRALLVDRHAYANPIEPVVCPILSLAVLTYCKGFRQVGGRQQVFEGHRTENKFSEVMGVILKAHQNLKNYNSERISKILEHTPRENLQQLMLVGWWMGQALSWCSFEQLGVLEMSKIDTFFQVRIKLFQCTYV